MYPNRRSSGMVADLHVACAESRGWAWTNAATSSTWLPSAPLPFSNGAACGNDVKVCPTAPEGSCLPDRLHSPASTPRTVLARGPWGSVPANHL